MNVSMRWSGSRPTISPRTTALRFPTSEFGSQTSLRRVSRGRTQRPAPARPPMARRGGCSSIVSQSDPSPSRLTPVATTATAGFGTDTGAAGVLCPGLRYWDLRITMGLCIMMGTRAWESVYIDKCCVGRETHSSRGARTS